jgi:hypothetical protein
MLMFPLLMADQIIHTSWSICPSGARDAAEARAKQKVLKRRQLGGGAGWGGSRSKGGKAMRMGKR